MVTLTVRLLIVRKWRPIPVYLVQVPPVAVGGATPERGGWVCYSSYVGKGVSGWITIQRDQKAEKYTVPKHTQRVGPGHVRVIPSQEVPTEGEAWLGDAGDPNPFLVLRNFVLEPSHAGSGTIYLTYGSDHDDASDIQSNSITWGVSHMS
jgi:hypothetical protein